MCFLDTRRRAQTCRENWKMCFVNLEETCSAQCKAFEFSPLSCWLTACSDTHKFPVDCRPAASPAAVRPETKTPTHIPTLLRHRRPATQPINILPRLQQATAKTTTKPKIAPAQPFTGTTAVQAPSLAASSTASEILKYLERTAPSSSQKAEEPDLSQPPADQSAVETVRDNAEQPETTIQLEIADSEENGQEQREVEPADQLQQPDETAFIPPLVKFKVSGCWMFLSSGIVFSSLASGSLCVFSWCVRELKRKW